MKTKILFLGSKPVGCFCLNHLIEFQYEYNIEIVGVLTNNTSRMGKADINTLCINNKIRIINNLEDIKSIDFDFLISVQYHEILMKEHLSLAKKMAINLHMAPLPEYRGCNQFTFAILDGKKEFGTTLHIMEEGIDSGAILSEKRFAIPDNCFVNQLYDLTCDASCVLFTESISDILNNRVKPKLQKEYLDERTTSLHFRKEINLVKIIDLNWDKEKIWKHIRATSMPGFPPPYTEIEGFKINLNIEK
jgi:methionyl-tRNA formyltransferase